MASNTQRHSIVIRQIEGRPGEVYYPLEKRTYTETEPGDEELVVKLSAVSLNHRDLFIRQHLYPGTTFNVPLCSDGCGTVIATGKSPSASALLHKRVIINPGFGWQEASEGPEDQSGYKILGGTKLNPKGTLAETIRVAWSDVEEAPSHLSDLEAAALPLTGLTAWRALVTKSGNAVAGRNILITGIGGGVALMLLAYSVRLGINAYVSSSDPAKLAKARTLGARGCVRYDQKGWEQELLAQLPEERRYLDAIIDGAGGSIVQSGVKLLKVSDDFVRSILCDDLELTSASARRCDCVIRNDHGAAGLLLDECCSQEHRSPGVHDGLPGGIPTNGQICRGERDPSSPFPGGPGYRQLARY
jgi:NADPH:quinone reductase-like Zn-dependent oxidoreductase